ncbi:MAG: family 20 glycosylhydrolase [Chitinophagaceae bacterium]
MKKIKILIFFQCICLMVFAQSANTGLSIIPEPVSMVKNNGQFILPKNIIIESGSNPAIKKIADSLSKQISVSTGYNVTVSSQVNAANTIRFLLNTAEDKKLGKEGYTLEVSPKNVLVKANQPAGLFYAVQTFLQLLPKDIFSKTTIKNSGWQSPCVSITDYPRFGWRGLMFDVSRHFFTRQEVKDFIDEMAKYKYNLLHFHLTDDEGWRIEIKSLPKLTEVGAWSVRRVGNFGEFAAPAADEPRDYGGFYTQDDIKELVQYAKEKYVDILPEVDIPGHSLSAIASYPDLSCTAGADKYRVRSGEKIMDWYTGGFSALVDNTLCPANEKVYVFLDKVFTELAALFPFEYIHIGGDECAKNFWEKSDAVKQLMQKEGLKNMEEVQSYFEKRVVKIVSSKGKKVIGWDEILEGGLAPNAAVMSWRGIKGGIEAAKLGHEVVMTPTTFVYLDYMQGDEMLEPPVYATLRLKTSYSFEPVPDGVDAKFILGGQGNLWTEQIFNTRHMQYMLWPRSLAIAECLWSPKEKKNWNSFTKKVEVNFERMDVRQVKYARSMFDPIIHVKKDGKDSLQIELSTEIKGLDIYYSFDYSNPDNFYPRYESALSIPKEASMLKIITYRGGKPIGRQLDIPISELRKRKE